MKYLILIISVIIFVLCLYSLFNTPHGEVTPTFILSAVGGVISTLVGMLAIFDLQENKKCSG